MKTVKKIVFLISLSISVIIVREFLSIYNDLKQIDEYYGYVFLILCSLITIVFIIKPMLQVLILPSYIPPTKNRNEIERVLKKRVNRLQKNKYLKNFDFGKYNSLDLAYKDAVNILESKVDQVRQEYISKVFYSTALVQNGFMDSIIILSANINLIKEIFTIYNGRATAKDLVHIATKIYTSLAIAGSEGVEYATDELFSKFGSDLLKSIPFIDKIMGSAADGFVNAMLVARISFITENYCKLLYLENDKSLLPSLAVVLATVNLIKKDVAARIKSKLSIW